MSNHQTTTMKKFGTMPDYMSIRNVAIGDKVLFPTGDPPPQPMGDEEGDDEEDYNEEDEGVSREDAIDVVQPDCVFEPDSDGQSDTEPIFEEALYDQRPDYMLGSTTRSGQAVRLSGKYSYFLVL